MQTRQLCSDLEGALETNFQSLALSKPDNANNPGCSAEIIMAFVFAKNRCRPERVNGLTLGINVINWGLFSFNSSSTCSSYVQKNVRKNKESILYWTLPSFQRSKGGERDFCLHEQFS